MPEGADATAATGSAPVPLASALAGEPTAFVRADVALDGELVVGSFTVDGMTFAVAGDGSVELVGVAPDRQQVASSQEGDGSPVAPMLASGPDGLAGDSSALALPESIAYEGVDYAVASIGAYAFYLSGVTSVGLPVSIVDVDERAFRSSDVASVEVDPANESYASFDGILYDASLSRLLLIPGGRTGAARISDKAEEVDARAFSHCAGVTSISVDAGSDSYSSWDGLLYDAFGTTLLRVPAGATDITIRDGCTAIAAGALEGCASLASITAPASVTSVSPDVFTSVPTVSLPAISALADDSVWADGEGLSTSAQLNALVALSAVDDDLPEVDSTLVEILLSEGADARPWQSAGFSQMAEAEAEVGLPQSGSSEDSSSLPVASLDEAAAYSAVSVPIYSNLETRVTMNWYTNYTHTNTTSATISPNGCVTFNDSFVRYRIETSSSVGAYMTFYYSEASWVTVTFAPTDSTNYQLLGIYNDIGYTMTSYNVDLYDSYTFYIAGMGKPCTVSLMSNLPTGGSSLVGKLYAPYGSSALYVDSAYGSRVTSSSLPKPSCAGYTFNGYYNSGTKWINSDGSKTSSFFYSSGVFNYTLTAGWSANTITLTWNSNGGSGVANTTQTYSTTAKVALPSSPTRAGYTFKGWFTSTTSSTKITNSTALPTSNTTYYAQWTANTITLTWNSNGGSSIANTSATYSSTAKVPMPSGNPTRAGYTFKGWFTSTTSTTQVTSSTALPTSNTTYYAQWTANTITLTWNSNGGSSIANTSATYSSTAKVPMPSSNPTRAGYTFAGWWTAASGGTQVTSSTALPTANATYHAHWSLNPYSITYELDGGSVSGNPTTYDIETTAFVLKNPIRLGYVFVGWSGTGLDGEANMVVTVAKGSSGDRSYTAHWAPAVAADVPLSVVASVDMLGIAEQMPASGYIESRSGGTLRVARVDFEPLAGATELFGTSTADVLLEALPGSAADASVRFALDAPASEDGASVLSSFLLPDGYGSRLPIAYRFAIPDDVLASIDPSRFEQATTSVCSVAYTVALA